MRLTRPSTKFWISFVEALDEYKQRGARKKRQHENIKENQKRYLESIETRRKKQIYIWWLVQGDKYVGRITLRNKRGGNGDISYNIRPSQRGYGYGKEMLRLALLKIRLMGKEEVVLVCRESNLPSKGVIEKNGGILIRVENKKNKESRLVYKIIL